MTGRSGRGAGFGMTSPWDDVCVIDLITHTHTHTGSSSGSFTGSVLYSDKVQ